MASVSLDLPHSIWCCVAWAEYLYSENILYALRLDYWYFSFFSSADVDITEEETVSKIRGSPETQETSTTDTEEASVGRKPSQD